MALFNDVLNGIGRVLRPVAKETIKTGIVAYREVAGLGEAARDLVAEASAEMGDHSSKKGQSDSGPDARS